MAQGSENTIVYEVVAKLPSESIAERYVGWMLNGHAAAVVAGGARAASVERLTESKDQGPIRVRSRYEFANMRAYESYVEHHAPALRAEGQRLFPAAGGIEFSRSVWVLVGRIDATSSRS